MRTKDGVWQDECDRQRAVAGLSQRHTIGSSGVCMHCCVLKTCSSTWSADAMARGDVAAAELIVERDVGVLAAGEMFEIGEGAGGLQLVVDDGRGGDGFDFVEHRRQLFVVGGDQLHGAFGGVRIGGEHDGDRLADIAHLVERQDRLIVKGGAVIGIGDELPDVLAGDDREDALGLARVGDIDRADAAMRDGAAEDLAVQHAGQAQIVDVVRAAGDLASGLRDAGWRGRSGSWRGHRLRLTDRAREIDAEQFLLVGGRAMRIGEERDFLDGGVARAARRLSSPFEPARTFSVSGRRVTFSVAALTMTHGLRIALPSAISQRTARPSAGQSSAEREVHFI